MAIYNSLVRRLRSEYRRTENPILLEALERISDLEGRGPEPLEIDLKSLKQTCSACPSQWDAWTPEGAYVYIRYRSAYLSVEVLDLGLGKGVTPEGFGHDSVAEVWFSRRLEDRDPLDGWIDIEEVCRLANLRLV